MRKRTLRVSRPTLPTIGGRSLSYVPCPRCLFARRRGGSAGSRWGSLFFPRILIQLICFRLLIVVKWTIRLQPQGVGLHLLTDKLHRLAAYAHFVRQDLRLFALNHTAYQQDDLFWFQAASFKDRLAIHVIGLITGSAAIIRHLATFRHPESAGLLHGCSTMRTRHALRMKVIHQPRITALARHQVYDGKLNWHDPPPASFCPQFTTHRTCPLHEPKR